MFRALLKLVVVLVILVGAGAFFLGWWGSGKARPVDRPAGEVSTEGKIDTDKAKAVGADLGAKTAAAANRAGEVLSDGALTAKIKSKMALDDNIRALAIDVDTAGTVVTLSGTVRTEAERTRAIGLARETAGVTEVKDRLVIR